MGDSTNVKGFTVENFAERDAAWEAERVAFRERSDLVARYERPVVAIRAAHLPDMPIVRTMSHRDIDEFLGHKT